MTYFCLTSCCSSIRNGHIWPLLVISNKSISHSVKSFWKFFELRAQFISFNNVVRIVISWTPWKTQNECLWICWFSYQRMSVCCSWADLTHQAHTVVLNFNRCFTHCDQLCLHSRAFIKPWVRKAHFYMHYNGYQSIMSVYFWAPSAIPCIYRIYRQRLKLCLGLMHISILLPPILACRPVMSHQAGKFCMES